MDDDMFEEHHIDLDPDPPVSDDNDYETRQEYPDPDRFIWPD